MEKIKCSTTAKVFALFLTAVSVMMLAGSFFVITILDQAGFYQTDRENMLEKWYAQACSYYSVTALADYKGNFNKEELLEAGFRFGVIRGDDLDRVDLSDSSGYAADYLGVVKNLDDLHVYEADIWEDSVFSYGSNIWDQFSISPGHEQRYEVREYPVEGYYYDTNTQCLYVRSGSSLFRIDDCIVYTNDGEIMPMDVLNNVYLEEHEQKESGGNSMPVYEWDSVFRGIEFDDGTIVEMQDIQIVDSVALAKAGAIEEDSILNSFEGDILYVEEPVEQKRDHYYVLSYVQHPAADGQSFFSGNLFAQADSLVSLGYRLQYPLIGLLAVSLLVFAASFIFLMTSAGHHKGEKKIRLQLFDRLPLDLFLAGIVFLEVLCCETAIPAAEQAVYQLRSGGGFVSWMIIAAGAAGTGIMLAASYCMSAAVHIKLGKWWRYTVIYWIGGKTLLLLRSALNYCLYLVTSLWRSVTLLWKAWVLLGVLAFVEYTAIWSSAGYYASDGLIQFWLIEKLIVYPVIIFLLMQMNKLQKGARQIAGGGLDFRINTDRMFWEMKKHGEYLNDIDRGMNRAVNERLKSEHFKTELITNVSHDIKTPLTSIINYVDLLQKEQIDNPTAQEYLEVLRRQSARLKKLIEDLMEASKASTGNLSVNMEKCDTSVMLIQTVGEFEEKLMENQIELQIKKPQENIVIEADSRHLWRVFDNLMNNICKYAQPTTRAYVNLEQDGQQAVIIFRNISKCQLNISSEELMERFVRGDSSRNTEGSGLGISIAKSLTELMKGTFELVVDGDLFKVVLSFPLYGAVKPVNIEVEEKEPDRQNVFEGLAAGVQNAGTCAADLGRSAAGRAGLVLQRAGRFAHHFRQAAEQTRSEEKERKEKKE